MSLLLERRELLALGTFGLSAAALPAAAQVAAARGFTHGIASGEPGHETALLWTRYVPSRGEEATLDYEVSDTEELGASSHRGPPSPAPATITAPRRLRTGCSRAGGSTIAFMARTAHAHQLGEPAPCRKDRCPGSCWACSAAQTCRSAGSTPTHMLPRVRTSTWSCIWETISPRPALLLSHARFSSITRNCAGPTYTTAAT